jgi:hypothetical protein
MPTIPTDGRPQFSGLDVALFNAARGQMPLAGMSQIGPDRYVLAGTFPRPSPTPRAFSPAVAATADAGPMTPARALWPDLPSSAKGDPT